MFKFLRVHEAVVFASSRQLLNVKSTSRQPLTSQVIETT